MTRTLAAVGLAAFCLTCVASGAAQSVADHLKCYKIKDPLRLAGTADLDTPQFGADPGCTISKAKLFCVPATKMNVAATDKLTGNSITPLPVTGTDPGDRICYKVKCPNLPADQSVTDQFGTRTLAKFKASMLCTPAVKGSAFCGDGTINGSEDCEGSNLGGATCQSLGFETGTLACAPGCSFDTSGCACLLSTCGNGAKDGDESCDGSDLGGASCVSLGYTFDGTLSCTAGCGYNVSGCRSQAFPATGQTTAYMADKNDGVPGAVAVPDDGTVQAGATLNYTDNGDGTITDNNTGLMWEKKSADGGLHDMDHVYLVWSGNGSQETIWDWVDDLNAEGGGAGFAGYSDWRIPGVKELESILDYERVNPSIAPVFDTNCTPGCTVLNCSCTVRDNYWSSTTYTRVPTFAWRVVFADADVLIDSKTNQGFVRAVRGGS